MKFCKTLIASALAAASIAPAFAEIADTYSTTGSELFLVVRAVAGTTENTFVKDLGVTFQDFLPNNKFALDNSLNLSYSLAGDANWTDFKTATSLTSAKWAVYSIYNNSTLDTDGIGSIGMLMTTNKPASGMLGTTTTNRLNDSKLQAAINNETIFISKTNTLAARACKPVRLLPLSVAEFEAAVPRPPRGSLIFVGSVAPRRMVLLARSARLVDAVLLPDCERIDLLAQTVFAARHRLVEGEQTTVVLTEASRLRATALLLSGHALPVTTRLPGSTLEGRDSTPAAADASLVQAVI